MTKCAHCKKMVKLDDVKRATIKTSTMLFGHYLMLCPDCDDLLERFYWEFIQASPQQKKNRKKR
jgi:hypothetical protein